MTEQGASSSRWWDQIPGRWRAVVVLGLVLVLGSQVLAAASRERLVQLLADPRFKVRIQAAAALAELRDPSTRPAIEGLLKDEDALVRAAACDALMAMGDPAALPAIERALRDEDDMVRRRARLAQRVLKGTQGLRQRSEGSSGTAEIGTVTDSSNSGHKGLDVALRRGLDEGLKERAMALGALRRRYQLIAQVRSVTERVDGGESRVDVQCHLTVAELPQRTMRLSTQVTAAASVSGRASPDEISELASDATQGAGAELIREFSSWAVVQPPP
ncbi:MAG: HEAT repeat domain-containing protein [Pseudomonadota bacterium]